MRQGDRHRGRTTSWSWSCRAEARPRPAPSRTRRRSRSTAALSGGDRRRSDGPTDRGLVPATVPLPRSGWRAPVDPRSPQAVAALLDETADARCTRPLSWVIRLDTDIRGAVNAVWMGCRCDAGTRRRSADRSSRAPATRPRGRRGGAAWPALDVGSTDATARRVALLPRRGRHARAQGRAPFSVEDRVAATWAAAHLACRSRTPAGRRPQRCAPAGDTRALSRQTPPDRSVLRRVRPAGRGGRPGEPGQPRALRAARRGRGRTGRCAARGRPAAEPRAAR